MLTITGKLPRIIVDTLGKLGVVIDDIITGGDDIDVTIEDTTLMGTFIGNGKWEVTELDDISNLFPELDEGDVVSSDLFTKLLTNKINSSLILSFNPLGKVKYGIKEIGDKIKDVGTKVVDWAADRLYAEDAENFIRKNGPYRRTFTDSRDGKTRTKRDYNASKVNVGKIEKMDGMGHYKVLTGNPATQDFQVWHLYKNGNSIRCLDLKTGLQAQEAQWVYDNNLPKSWTEADWNPEGEIPEKANKIEVGDGNVEKGKDNNQTEKNESQTEEVEQDDNLDEWVKQYYADKGKDADILMNNLIRSSIEDSDSSLFTDEDNVIESKPKKKNLNVTGCTKSDGTVVMASIDENVIDGEEITSRLITEDLKQFIDYTGTLKDVDKSVVDKWKEIKNLLLDIATLDKEVLKNMTRQSGDNLIIDFNETGTGQNYAITVELTPNRINVTDKVAPGKEYEHLIQSLKTVKEKLEPKF